MELVSNAMATVKRWRAAPNAFLYFLGVVGWIVLAAHYPFDWALPEYANY